MDQTPRLDLHDQPLLQPLIPPTSSLLSIPQISHDNLGLCESTSQIRINSLKEEALEPRPLNQREQNLLAVQPHFLRSLYKILEEKDYAFWNQTGSSFFIVKPTEFATEVLPFYFKHHNLNSFIRQLNVYGFKKVKLGQDHNNLLCYQHELFQANQILKISQIKRNAHAGSTHYDEQLLLGFRNKPDFRNKRDQVDRNSEVSTIESLNQKVTWLEGERERMQEQLHIAETDVIYWKQRAESAQKRVEILLDMEAAPKRQEIRCEEDPIFRGAFCSGEEERKHRRRQPTEEANSRFFLNESRSEYEQSLHLLEREAHSYLENYSDCSSVLEEAKMDIVRERSFINSHLTKELLDRLEPRRNAEESELSGRASRIESVQQAEEEVEELNSHCGRREDDLQSVSSTRSTFYNAEIDGLDDVVVEIGGSGWVSEEEQE